MLQVHHHPQVHHHQQVKLLMILVSMDFQFFIKHRFIRHSHCFAVSLLTQGSYPEMQGPRLLKDTRMIALKVLLLRLSMVHLGFLRSKDGESKISGMFHWVHKSHYCIQLSTSHNCCPSRQWISGNKSISTAPLN